MFGDHFASPKTRKIDCPNKFKSTRNRLLSFKWLNLATNVSRQATGNRAVDSSGEITFGQRRCFAAKLAFLPFSIHINALNLATDTHEGQGRTLT
jgi:hypothetical protein